MLDSEPFPPADRMLFFFDYADPLSWTVELAVGERSAAGVTLERFPFRSDLTDAWEARVGRCQATLNELGVDWMPPSRPVKSQKAFELAFYAAELGCFERVHAAIFGAHFVSGRDIGRVDELVHIAHAAELDASEAKAVLDVDRHAEAVRAWTERAARARVKTTPTLVDGERYYEDFAAVERLLRPLG